MNVPTPPAVSIAEPHVAQEVALEANAVDRHAASSGPLTRHALVLGMLTALGAFGIDAYLPAFPEIAKGLHVDEGAVQLSLVSYFVALAAGQLAYGPISDRIGRKPPLIFGFVLFVLASVGSAFAPTIGVLVAMRFVQGLGACAGMVISRAVVRDLRSGEEAARLFALMILVLGVSPILAPMSGSLLIAWFPWQSVFWMLAILGSACLLLVLLFLEETNGPARRSGGLGAAFRAYEHLAKDRHFLATTLMGGFSQGAVFAYLAGSPFVYITLRGVAPGTYSALFAGNAVALVGAAQFNVRIMRRLGPFRLLRVFTLTQSVAAVLLLAAAIFQHDTVPVMAVLLCVTIGCQGLLGPTSGVLALEPHAASAGAASALMGALQFGCGAASSGLVSLFFNGTSVPMAGVIAGCAIAGALVVYLAPAPRADSITA